MRRSCLISLRAPGAFCAFVGEPCGRRARAARQAARDWKHETANTRRKAMSVCVWGRCLGPIRGSNRKAQSRFHDPRPHVPVHARRRLGACRYRGDAARRRLCQGRPRLGTCADGRWGMSGDLCRQARRRMRYESRELTRVAGQVPRGELRHQPQLRGRPQRARRPRPLQARAAGLGPRAGAGYGQSLTRQRRGPGRWRASRSLEGAGVERVSEGAKG